MQGTETPSAHTEDVDMAEDEDIIGLEGLYILAMEDASRGTTSRISPKGATIGMTRGLSMNISCIVIL
jgi:hypothetical protein